MNNLKEQNLFETAIRAWENNKGKSFSDNKRWARKRDIVKAYKTWYLKAAEELNDDMKRLNRSITNTLEEDKTNGSFVYLWGSSTPSNDFERILSKYKNVQDAQKKIKQGEELFSLLFGQIPSEVKVSMEGEEEIIGNEPQLILENK